MRGDGMVYQRGNRWWLSYYMQQAGRSVQVREPGGATEQEALKKLKFRRKQRSAQELGLDAFQGPQSEKLTVEGLLRSLEAAYDLAGKERRKSTSHMKHLRAFFGLERVGRVTAERLADYQRHRLTEQAKEGTINRELRILRRAFNLAVDQKKLLKSSVPKFVLFSEEHAVREGFVEKGQLQAIVSHLADADVRDYALWAFWTGMRKGEIAKLTWAAFDKETWTLTLPGRITKNKKPRKLALEGPYREIVKRRMAARRLDCPLIFHRDGKPMGSFRKAWASACRRAGVAGLLFHDLRRTAVRNMIRAGVDRKIARMISGHKTEAIFTRYDISDDDDLRDAVLKMEQYVAGLPAASNVVSLDAVKAVQS